MNYQDIEYYAAMGARIRQLRIEKNMTPSQLARAAQLPCSRSVRRIEKGKNVVKLGTVRRICKALDADFAELMYSGITKENEKYFFGCKNAKKRGYLPAD